MLKYLNDFYKWNLSISLQKRVQTNKANYNQTEHEKIGEYFFSYLQGSILFK